MIKEHFLIEVNNGMVCSMPMSSLILSVLAWIGFMSIIIWIYRFAIGKQSEVNK